jgi:hypothetical protein
MIDSYASGESSNVKEAFQQVDWKEVVKYTVAGAVAGGTFGAINPAATVAGAAFAGGVGNLLGGQAAALTDATWNMIDNTRKGEKPEVSYGMGFLKDARKAGFLDGEQMLWDFGTGAAFGGLMQGLTNFSNSTGGVNYVTKAARAQNAALPGFVGGYSRVVSQGAKELFWKFLDKKRERIEKMLDEE